MKTLKLMVKTHCHTGMNYLCVTTKDDWQNYTGSGKYWKQHLKKHGKNFKTELIVELPMLCVSTFNELCLKESIANNVVESDEWANLCLESGYQNGVIGLNGESRRKIGDANRGKVVSVESREKISKNNAKVWKGKTFSEEHRKRLSENSGRGGRKNRGKQLSAEHRKKLSERLKAFHAAKRAERQVS